ncbi:SDR family NAD(P)-dependent oxidoreductase [Sphaerisporangium dianthi]|uniref:SDR family NAD(P)-dependent oxidoreductase n=1 Tax=Sphaerisporangium dianthi TaxID=1436120 RepID=A0ABV9CSH8_9ACTN
MSGLSGKTALVTGASRGIGRAIAQRLAADGALVAVHYARQDDAAKETVTEIEQAGGQAFPLRAELGVEGDLDSLFAGLAEGFGDRPLDILVNNAGIATVTAGSIDQITPESFDRIFAVNVRAPLFLIQRALPLMSDGGRIVSISSASTRIANPDLAYSMTKGAIDVLGRLLAHAVGSRSITVNTVAAGIIDTDLTAWLRHMPDVAAALSSMTALGRIGQPSEIADAVAFLVSDDARFVTGHVLDATGGFFLGPPVG